VTCPCALALATPLAVTAAIGRAARRGILIKGGDALETLAGAGTVVLDKTGTITDGAVALVRWDGPHDALRLAAALERQSRHPAALAIARAAPDARAAVSDVVETLGGGISGVVDGRRVAVGSSAYVGARLGPEAGALPAAAAGSSAVYVGIDGALAGVASLDDPVRADAAAAVTELRALGWRVHVLSGDDPHVVAGVARAVGVGAADAVGGATPEAKHARIAALAEQGPVVMVGDGVNDAPAMAAATVGIGVHGGAEASLATADVFLARPGLGPLVELVRGARRTMTLVRLGIGASIAYNVAGAALAFTGTIDPLIAAIMMPASSVSVVLLAWHGPTFEPPGDPR
jgi:Cu2+-exporting ATPase